MFKRWQREWSYYENSISWYWLVIHCFQVSCHVISRWFFIDTGWSVTRSKLTLLVVFDSKKAVINVVSFISGVTLEWDYFADTTKSKRQSGHSGLWWMYFVRKVNSTFSRVSVKMVVNQCQLIDLPPTH